MECYKFFFVAQVYPKKGITRIQSYDMGMGCFDHQSYSTWMSQEVSKWLGSVGYNPNESPIYN